MYWGTFGSGAGQSIGDRRPSGAWGALTVALLATALLTGLPSLARAGNWFGATGGTGCLAGNMQDNNQLTFRRAQLTSLNSNAVINTIFADVAPTDITVLGEDSDPNPWTDIIYGDADYAGYCGFSWHPDGGTIGHTNCVALSGSKCQQFHIRFDVSWTCCQSWTEAPYNLACHETGHALGLKHRWLDGCMYPHPKRSHVYSDHDRVHLNANY